VVEAVDGLHRVEGYLGLSHYRGDRIDAQQMDDGRRALEVARAALSAVTPDADEREVPNLEYLTKWATREFGVSNGTQTWVEFQGSAEMLAKAVLDILPPGTTPTAEALEAAGSPPERRTLDRDFEAFVHHYNGGYLVTAGESVTEANNITDAYRIAFVHNELRIHPTGAWRMRGAVTWPSNND
jgi:hypothetical protein